MFAKRRTYNVGKVETVEDLAEKLTEHTWTLCTAFSLEGLLFLNDASHEDGAGEWAVVIPKERMQDNMALESFGSPPTSVTRAQIPDGWGIQVESITFSWCTRDHAIEHINTCLKYLKGAKRLVFARPLKLDLSHGRVCPLCA